MLDFRTRARGNNPGMTDLMLKCWRPTSRRWRNTWPGCNTCPGSRWITSRRASRGCCHWQRGRARAFRCCRQWSDPRRGDGEDVAVAEFGSDHQRGAAAVVDRVDGRAGTEQQLDDIHGGAGADAVLAARRPHQRGQVVAVGAPGIDAGLEQAADDERKPAPGGICHDHFCSRVHDIGIGARGDELIEDATAAFEGGRRKRGDARWARVRIGTPRQQHRNAGLPLVLDRGVKRSRTGEDLARVERRARATRKSTSATCPARAARASVMAPATCGKRYAASSRRRASGRQPESAAAERREIELGRLGLGLDQVEPAFELAAGGSRGADAAAKAGIERRRSAWSRPAGQRDLWNSAGPWPAAHSMVGGPLSRRPALARRQQPSPAPSRDAAVGAAPMRSWHCSGEAPVYPRCQALFWHIRTPARSNKRLSRSVPGEVNHADTSASFPASRFSPAPRPPRSQRPRRGPILDDGQSRPADQRAERAAELADDEWRLRLDALFQAHPVQSRQRQEFADGLGAGARRHAGRRPERSRERSQSVDRQRLHVHHRWLGHGLQDRRPQSEQGRVRLDQRFRRSPRGQCPAHARHRAVGRPRDRQPA